MNAFLVSFLCMAAGQAGRVAPARPAIAGPAAVVTFKTFAQVSDRTIRLGDVAAVEGQNRKLVAALEAVEVGAAPISSFHRTVSADYSKIRIKQAGIPIEQIIFGGANLIEVARLDQVVTGASIEKAAVDALESITPGLTAKASVSPRDIRLPMGNVDLKAQAPSQLNGSSCMVPVQIMINGHQEAQVSISLRILHRGQALVAVRDIATGATISEGDVRVEERPIPTGPVILSDPLAAIGQQTAGPIKSGTPLTAIMLRPATIVKRGSRIKLICKSSSFTISTSGEALQDGAEGQIVRVRNAVSLLELSGRVIGPDVVEVQY